jgi:hypothetical protein
MILLVTYDLNKSKNYDAIYTAISQLGETMKDPGLDSVWFVYTNYTAEQASNHLRNSIDKDDRLFVVKVNSGQRDGWMNNGLWDWIRARE